MEKKITGKFLKFVVGICLFSILLFSAGKMNAHAALLYNVKFNNILGTSTSSVYTRLNQQVEKGTIIVLPSVVAASGYRNLGWTTTKGAKAPFGTKEAPLYKFGTKVKIVGHANFYLAREKITYCTASFRNSSGGTNASYNKMTQKVEKGTVITLPALGKVTGYINLGWTTAKGKSTPLYECGSNYKLSANTTFYAVRKRTYTVSFADQDGTAGEEFTRLNQTVPTGTKINLPEAPEKAGSTFSGWAATQNASKAEYTVGTSYKVSKNIKLYAVYADGVCLKFMNNDGSRQVGSLSVAKGEVVKLLGYHEAGYTMMGWSNVPNQSLDVKYSVGQNVTLKKDYVLYAVMFDKKKEINYTANTLPQIDTRKYTKVILVGDSRTTLMKEALQKEMPASVLNGVSFVCKKGSGLSWLSSTGYTKLLAEIGNGGTENKPIAIVFNSGVNDLLKITEYIKFMNQIAPELKAKNCKLFYMSVNPVNNVVLTNRGLNIPEERLRSFNSKIKTYLCPAKGSYTYLDTYTELYKNGFGHDNGSGKDDGLHFTAQTYKSIYAYVVTTLNNQ